MTVTLFKANRMFTLTLPEKVKGQYWLCDEGSDGQPHQFARIEAENGHWVLKGSRYAAPLGRSGEVLESLVLSPLMFLEMAVENCAERVLLFTEMPDQSRTTFTKVVVTAPEQLVIGRNPGSNLQYDSLFVSGSHARLDFDGREFSITDTNSTNGTYVNGFRVNSARLSAGDVVYVMGLKVVIGSGFFAVNNPDGLLKLCGQNLAGYAAQQPEQPQLKPVPDARVFSREPRLIELPQAQKIKIDAPPAARTRQEIPAAFMMGPAITMALTSLCVAVISVTGSRTNGGSWMQAAPALLMSASMMLSAVLWPTLTRKYEKQKTLAEEKTRQERYLAYLDRVRDQIRRMSDAQSAVLCSGSPTPQQCAQTVLQESSTLWNRGSNQPDFLRLRLGSGTLPLLAEVEYEEQRFSLADDTLEGAMLALGQEPRELQNVPVAVDLFQERVMGIYGDKAAAGRMLQAIVLQLISQYGYDEVKIAVLSENAAPWNWVRFLPHCWNEEKTARYFACSEEEAKELSVQLETLQQAHAAHCVVICDSHELLRRCTSVMQAVRQSASGQAESTGKADAGIFSLVLGAQSRSDTLKESRVLVDVSGETAKLYHCSKTGEKPVEFVPDEVPGNLLAAAAQRLANLQLDSCRSAYTMPTMLTFMEMYGVGKIEHFNVLTRWKENNPVISLKAPIGVDPQGELFYLDLHEKYHGPHGLVAGMTGSGKSEFIITYILSLALNYHPDEVSFILIDYKGGGLAGAFEDKESGIHLPHLAGTITNLDGAAIQRSLISVQSELRRRQAIFNEARHRANEGTMDIYKYQQLYREGVVSEPVPHLFIISDEFAELKAQQPEFMDQLISTARIGRSLGVHLILATQKPSGVVNDQIWSNSRFRVCLKVQEKADSQDMIKRPDAASISQTGRFYLQVGYNELFALGQSAWCGAEYIPSDTAEKKPDAAVQVIDRTGREVLRAAPAQKQQGKKHAKQVVAIVKYLSELAAEEGVGAKPLWLPAIPAKIYQDMVEEKYASRDSGFVLQPVVGEYDDPYNQKQGPLTLPITEKGNVLLYGSGGVGKEEFVTTMCYALLKNHTAQQLNLYILDFGTETLRSFAAAPQVGGVAIGIETEKIRNLFRFLQREMARRKQLFAPYGGEHAAYCSHSGSTEPNIVVLLHNYPAFMEQYEELAEQAAKLCREGTHCAIYFVITATGSNSVRYSMMQNFGILMTLRQNDAGEYASIVGRTGGMVPTNCSGRGLVRGKALYEFQTALCTGQEDVFGFVRSWCAELAQKDKARAVPIPMLPERVSAQTLLSLPSSCRRVPVGFTADSVEPAYIDLTAGTIYPVASGDADALQSFAQEWLPVLAKQAPLTLLDAGRKLQADAAAGCEVPGSMSEAVAALFEELVSRNNAYKDSGCKRESLQGFAEKIVLIYDMPALIQALSAEEQNGLRTILGYCESIYKMHFVIAGTDGQWQKLTGESWYAQRMNAKNGIWLGSDVASQRVLSTAVTREMYALTAPGFGWVIRGGRSELAKLLCAPGDEKE